MGSVALRHKQVRAAQAVASGLSYVEAGAVVGRSARTVTRWLQDPQLRAIAERDASATGLRPREVLDQALRATKANGQPDWSTRLAASRLLGVPADPVEDPLDERPQVSITVCDLPTDATPITVQHRPRDDDDAPAPGTEPSPEPAGNLQHWFSYEPADGESVRIGTWSPPQQESSEFVTIAFQITEDHATAERWRTELAAGQLPDISNNSP